MQSDEQPGAGPYSIGSDNWPGLAKLAEECGEVIQVIGKLIAMGGAENYDHWGGTQLRDRLIEEMGDVRAAMIFVCEQNGIDKQAVHDRADMKLALFNRWHTDQMDESTGPRNCDYCKTHHDDPPLATCVHLAGYDGVNSVAE